MSADLSIKVEADLGGTLSKIDQLKAKLGQTKENVELIKLELKGMGQSLTANDKAIASTNKQIKGMTIGSKEAAKEAAGLKAQLATLAQVNSTLVQGIAKTKVELSNETAALKIQSAEVKKAETAGSGFSKGLNTIWGGLRKIAYIVPGLGIAGLIGLISGPLVAAFEDLFKVTEKAGDSLKKAFSENAASEGGNIARLESLVKIAKDVSKEDGVRQQALGALNKEYDLFNGKLTKANINTAFATDLITKQSAAIIRQAQIKGLENLITKETEKQAEIATRSLEKNLSLIDMAKLSLKGVSNIFSPANRVKDAVVESLKQRDKAIDESKGTITEYKKFLESLLNEEAENKSLFIAPEPKKIKEKLDKITPKVQDIFRKWRAEIAEGLPDSQGTDTILPKAGEMLNGILGPEALQEVRMKSELLGMGITKGIQDGVNMGVDGLRFPDLKALWESSKEKLADLNSAITEISKNTFEDIATGMADALGTGESMFSAFLKMLGSGLQQLGKYMVSISGIITGIKVAMKSLNPTALLIGGLALVAIGAALKNVKIPGFADGVTNFGGGIAMVGERGPELVRLPKGSDVIPNGRVNGMLAGGGAQVFIPAITLRGQDLVVAFNRANQTIGRNG